MNCPQGLQSRRVQFPLAGRDQVKDTVRIRDGVKALSQCSRGCGEARWPGKLGHRHSLSRGEP
jgi:hypothetical protein